LSAIRSPILLKGVGGAPNADYAGTMPQQTFMLFQMMFAIITPALISGAVAERIKFKAYVLFMLLWVTVVYFPLCHMVWGKGGFFNWALGGKIPGAGFRGRHGGAHQLRRVGAGVRAVLGKRDGYPQEPMMPHNVVL
jgi:Amt family ammonium transporter